MKVKSILYSYTHVLMCVLRLCKERKGNSFLSRPTSVKLIHLKRSEYCPHVCMCVKEGGLGPLQDAAIHVSEGGAFRSSSGVSHDAAVAKFGSIDPSSLSTFGTCCRASLAPGVTHAQLFTWHRPVLSLDLTIRNPHSSALSV